MAGDIIVLTGPVGAGKTTALRVLWGRLPSVAGFAAVRVFEDKDALIGYDLVEARSDRRIPFLRLAPPAEASGAPEPGRSIGRFAVSPGALEAAAEILRTSPPSSLLAVDELGPAEREGGGHWPALRPLLDEPARRFLFVVRRSCLEDFRERFGPRPVRVLILGRDGDAGRITQEIVDHAGPR